MKELDYYIVTEKLHPPFGRYQFAAKAEFPQKAHDHEWPIPLPLKECYGVTEQEAIEKVRQQVKEWAAKVGVQVTEI